MRPSYPSSCSFSENGTLPFCFCYNRYNCTASESIRLDFSSVPGINSADPSLDDIRHAMVHFLGERCRAPVNYAITQSLLDCNDKWATLDAQLRFHNGHAPREIHDVCNSFCLRVIFTSITTLLDAQCLYQNGLPALALPVTLPLLFFGWSEVLCAKGNGNLCGVTEGMYLDFVQSGSVSAADCQTIVDSGKCLGTVSEAYGDFIKQGWNVSDIVSALDGNCTAHNVIGIAQAAQGAEPKAALLLPSVPAIATTTTANANTKAMTSTSTTSTTTTTTTSTTTKSSNTDTSTHTNANTGSVTTTSTITTTTTGTNTTATTSTTTTTANFFESPPTLQQARAHLVSELGASCTSAINSNIDGAVLECLVSYSAGDLAQQADQDLDAYVRA